MTAQELLDRLLDMQGQYDLSNIEVIIQYTTYNPEIQFDRGEVHNRNANSVDIETVFTGNARRGVVRSNREELIIS